MCVYIYEEECYHVIRVRRCEVEKIVGKLNTQNFPRSHLMPLLSPFDPLSPLKMTARFRV